MTFDVCAHVVHARPGLATQGALEQPAGGVNGTRVFVQRPLVGKRGAAGLAGEGLGGVVAPFVRCAGALVLEHFGALAALVRPL